VAPVHTVKGFLFFLLTVDPPAHPHCHKCTTPRHCSCSSTMTEFQLLCYHMLQMPQMMLHPQNANAKLGDDASVSRYMSTSDIVLMIAGAQKYVCIVSRCPSLSPVATCKMGVKYIMCTFFSGKNGCDSMHRFALPMCLPVKTSSSPI